MTVQAGTFVKTASPHAIEVLGVCGVDFAVIDAEHGPFDRAMMGATGLLQPHVERAAQAAQIVRNTRFATGDRGCAATASREGNAP